jgi:hypothetical protein
MKQYEKHRRNSEQRSHAGENDGGAIRESCVLATRKRGFYFSAARTERKEAKRAQTCLA